MNWIIFTTECSGKTTFCVENEGTLNGYELVEWDIVKDIPNRIYENEILLIDLLLELQDKNDKIYLTNILPPNFILDCNKYYPNIRFAIIRLDDNQLKANIKKRHNKEYNHNYILDANEKLKQITNTRLQIFNSYSAFKSHLLPSTNNKAPMIKRLIRL